MKELIILIIGDIKTGNNVVYDVFVLKYVHLCFLWFYLIFKVFITIHNYTNQMICKYDHRIKNICLSFNLTPIVVF